MVRLAKISVITPWIVVALLVYLLDTGEEVLATHPRYDPDATQLEPDDSDFNQDLLESDGTLVKIALLHTCGIV